MCPIYQTGGKTEMLSAGYPIQRSCNGGRQILDGILGIINVAAGNYVDMINGQIATKNNIGLTLIGASATSQSVYVGGVIRETGTARAADAIDIRLGIIKD